MYGFLLQQLTMTETAYTNQMKSTIDLFVACPWYCKCNYATVDGMQIANIKSEVISKVS